MRLLPHVRTAPPRAFPHQPCQQLCLGRDEYPHAELCLPQEVDAGPLVGPQPADMARRCTACSRDALVVGCGMWRQAPQVRRSASRWAGDRARASAACTRMLMCPGSSNSRASEASAGPSREGVRTKVQVARRQVPQPQQPQRLGQVAIKGRSAVIVDCAAQRLRRRLAADVEALQVLPAPLRIAPPQFRAAGSATLQAPPAPLRRAPPVCGLPRALHA